MPSSAPATAVCGSGSSRTTTFTRTRCGFQQGSRKPPSLLRSMAARKSILAFSISFPTVIAAFSLLNIQALIFIFVTWFAKKSAPGLGTQRCVRPWGLAVQLSSIPGDALLASLSVVSQVVPARWRAQVGPGSSPRHDLIGVQKSAGTERRTKLSEILYFIFSVSRLCWRQFMILLRPLLKVFSIITGPKRGLCRVAKTSLGVWLPTGLGFRRSGKTWSPALGFPASLCPLCAHSTSIKQIPSPRVRVQWSIKAPAFLQMLGTPATSQTLPSAPSFLMTFIPSVGYLWGRIQCYWSSISLVQRKKGKGSW